MPFLSHRRDREGRGLHVRLCGKVRVRFESTLPSDHACRRFYSRFPATGTLRVFFSLGGPCVWTVRCLSGCAMVTPTPTTHPEGREETPRGGMRFPIPRDCHTPIDLLDASDLDPASSVPLHAPRVSSSSRRCFVPAPRLHADPSHVGGNEATRGGPDRKGNGRDCTTDDTTDRQERRETQQERSFGWIGTQRRSTRSQHNRPRPTRKSLRNQPGG